MRLVRLAALVVLVVFTSVPTIAAPFSPTDITGTYELVTRTLANGKVLKRPDIAGLYTMAKGRANLNLFIRNADGKLASESSIIRYTLSATRYC